MANPIRFSEIFDFTSDKDVRDALALIKNLDKVYTKLINNAKKLAPEYAKQNKIIATSVLELNKVVSGLNPILERDQKQLAAASKSMDIMSAASEGLTKKTATLGTTVKSLESEQKKFNKAASETIKLDKEQERLKAKLASLDTKQAAETAKLRLQIQEKNKALRQSAKESLGLVTIYQKESARLNELAMSYKNLVVAGKQNTKVARELKREHDALRATIIKADQSVGQYSKTVGNYATFARGAANITRQLVTALGFTGVVFALVGAFRGAFNIMRDFQKQNAVLAGVLGTTRKGVATLTADAERLGASTAKTASEVTGLQVEFARLGFTQNEILGLTEATINGSIALNAELDRTAALVGAIVRTFDDFESVDAPQIVDQLTLAANSSALSFSKLETAIPIVAGAANAAKVPFNEVLAVLGKLADAGIDASTAATSFRNILIESASQGRNYKELIEDIRTSNDRLTTSFDFFGKRGAVAGAVLSGVTEETEKLAKALGEDFAGKAADAAAVQLDTVAGSAELAKSAIQGLILSIENGTGPLASFIKTFIEQFTGVITLITGWNEGIINTGELLLSLQNPAVAAANRIKILSDQTTKTFEAQRKQLITAEEAERLYTFAVENNIKTWDDFQKLEPERLISKLADKQEVLTAVQRRFTKELLNQADQIEDTGGKSIKMLEEELKLLKERLKVAGDFESRESIRALIAAKQEEIVLLKGEQGEMQVLTEYFEKFGIVALQASKTTVDGLKPVGEAIEANLDKPMVAAEKRGKEVTKNLAFYWKQFAEQIQLALTTAFESASIALNQFFTNQDIKRENSFVKFEDQRQSEIDALEAKREKELENENLTTESKKAINKKYAEAIGAIEGQMEDKRKQTQIQQAKAAKKQAIFNILLNTAQGITAALTSIPPNVPLSIAIGIIGGVQLAAAASQPLPAFAKGTDNAPGGPAVVGDGGKRELVVEPSGRTYLTSDSPEIRNIPKGSKVFPDADLVDREFGSTIMRNITAGQAFDREIDNHNASVNKLQAVLNQERLNNDQFRKTLTATLEKENDYMVNKFISGLHSLPLNNWSFTDKGQVTRSVQKGNTIRKNVELENKY